MHYSDLIRTDPVLTPHDVLSEALYANTKLDYLLQAEDSRPAHDSSALELAQQSTETDEATPDADKEATNESVPLHTSKTASPWKLRRVLAGAHQGWVRSVTVDPVTNLWFATGSSDASLKIWDLASGDLKASLSGHILGVRALVVSNRYSYMFSGSEDKTVRCWDLERTNSAAGCQIRNYHGHVGGVYTLALHPELDLLFSAGRDSVIRAWDLRSRNQVMVLSGHSNDITSIVAQVGDPQICSSSMDSTVRLWDIRKQTTHLALTHHSKSIRLLVMHPQEMTMASGDSAGNIKQWLLPGGQLLHAFGSSNDINIINTMAINPASNELFAGFSDGRMHFYDYETGNLLQSAQSTPAPGTDTSTIYTSAFDMLGLRLIVGESDKSIKIWGAE